MEVSTISKSELSLTEIDESIDGLIVIVNVRVGDEVVNAVHLH
jgi:hypothetical protein